MEKRQRKVSYCTDFVYVKEKSKLKSMCTAECNFESLNISVDDILTYFVFNGLNDLFKSQLTVITNSLRPDLKSITENFFTATERYENARKNKLVKSQIKSDLETLCILRILTSVSLISVPI